MSDTDARSLLETVAYDLAIGMYPQASVDVAQLCDVALAALRAKDDEIERLRSRLEVDHTWRLKDGSLERVPAKLPEHLDGISCRDETIKLLEDNIEKLRSEIAELRKPNAAVLMGIEIGRLAGLREAVNTITARADALEKEIEDDPR